MDRTRIGRVALAVVLATTALVAAAARADATTALSVTLSLADPSGTRYFWGDEIPYVVHIANTGTDQVDGIALSLPGGTCAELLTTVLIENEDLTVDCTYPTVHDDVGTYTTSAVVTSNQLPPIQTALRSATVRPGAALLAGLSTDKAGYVLGEDIEYTIAISNRAHHATISGIAYSFSDGDCIGPLTTILLPGEGGAMDHCTRTSVLADLGTHHHEVSDVQSEQTGEVPPAAVDVFVGLRPDALIRVGAGSFRGDGVYDRRAGIQQGVFSNLGARAHATFTIKVQNDSPEPDDLRVRGSGGTRAFLLTYRRDGAVVNNQVTGAGLVFADVAPGDSRTLTLRITALPASRPGDLLQRLVTVSSGTTPSVKDGVSVRINRIRPGPES